MTYEQSMLNIETVKKYRYLYDNNCVYLQFKNDTEFDVINLPQSDDETHSLVLDNFYIKKLAYGHVWHPPLRSEPHLRYIDTNVNFFLNLTTNEFTLEFSDSPEEVDVEEARKDYLEIIKLFK